MATYNPWAELMATQQSLLEEYGHQLNKVIKRMWHFGAASHNACRLEAGTIPINSTGPAEGEENASKLFALETFNEELLSVAKEQHQQLGAHAQYSSTDSASEC